MEIGHIIPHIEALVFASDKPLTPIDLTELINNAFGFMEDKVTMEQVQTAMEGIVEKYHSEFYPFEMRESGGGWQFLTKKEYHKTVAQLNGEKFLKRLSTAALETLAIIAYKQPLTKSDIESIRGVNCDYSIQKLLEKELIIISGRNEELPGKPLIYNTSRTFMDYFGINSPDDLPKLKEIFEEAMVSPTMMSQPAESLLKEPVSASEEETEIAALVVTENGELLEDTDLIAHQEAPDKAAEDEPVESEDAGDGHNDEEQPQPGDEQTDSGEDDPEKDNLDDETKG
ncbi:MAG: SMC-Scp complex subunit ScpB [Flavitalea sp.]